MNRTLSRIIHSAASLKVAVVLLILIALYVVIGTLLPQHSAPEWYLQTFPTLGPIIVSLSLYRAYSSPIFITLVLLFAINLSSCTLLSLKGQLRQAKTDYFPQFTSRDHTIDSVDETTVVAFCKKKRMPIQQDTESGSFRAGKFPRGRPARQPPVRR